MCTSAVRKRDAGEQVVLPLRTDHAGHLRAFRVVRGRRGTSRLASHAQLNQLLTRSGPPEMKLSSFVPLSISLALASSALAQAGAGQTFLTEEHEAKIGAGAETFQYQVSTSSRMPPSCS
mgnify:CR=1 FL=1